MKAELVPDNGDPPIPITKDLTVVGRKDCCDVCIDDPSLSKRHCVLVKTDGLLVVRDLATTNGTKVKGQRVRWAALLPDDRLTLGAYKVRIYLGPDELPSPSEGRKEPRKAQAVAVPARATAAAAATVKLSATAKPIGVAPSVGFPAPSPLEVPAVGAGDMGLEIIEDDDDGGVSSDSGWRKLINTKHDDDDEVLIELD